MLSSIYFYDQQDATYIMIFIINNALHVSGVFRPSGAYELYEQPKLLMRLRWSRGSVLAFGTQVRGFEPGRSRRIF